MGETLWVSLSIYEFCIVLTDRVTAHMETSGYKKGDYIIKTPMLFK